jgi:hypothetical protein
MLCRKRKKNIVFKYFFHFPIMDLMTIIRAYMKKDLPGKGQGKGGGQASLSGDCGDADEGLDAARRT